METVRARVRLYYDHHLAVMPSPYTLLDAQALAQTFANAKHLPVRLECGAFTGLFYPVPPAH